MLRQFLDYHRATLRLKCAGRSDEQLRDGPSRPPAVLLGLVRHLTEVERKLVCPDSRRPVERTALLRQRTNPDGDFDDLGRHPVAEVWSAFEQAVSEPAASWPRSGGSDRPGHSKRPRNVLWVLVHMIEEYARHNGHADLLRERIDGPPENEDAEQQRGLDTSAAST